MGGSGQVLLGCFSDSITTHQMADHFVASWKRLLFSGVGANDGREVCFGQDPHQRESVRIGASMMKRGTVNGTAPAHVVIDADLAMNHRLRFKKQLQRFGAIL